MGLEAWIITARSHLHNVAVEEITPEKSIRLERNSHPWPLQGFVKSFFFNQENLRVIIPLEWSRSRSMIQDHSSHGASKEPKNPYPEWIHKLDNFVFVFRNEIVHYYGLYTWLKHAT